MQSWLTRARPKRRLWPRHRRRWLGVVIGLIGAQACSQPQPQPQPKNLLVICLDTVRFDSFWLPERAGLTDSLSSWNRAALRFNQALAPSPWTLPSVASLLTGRYPIEHAAGFRGGRTANLDVQVPAPLPPAIPTLSELLHDHGYQVAGLVAQPYTVSPFGLDRGFFDLVDRDILEARAESWLDRYQAKHSDAPFFLYLHFVDAHQFHLGNPEELKSRAQEVPAAMREAAIAAAPASLCRSETSSRCLRFLAYTQAVLKQRRAVAGLLESLSRRGLLDQTVALLYSDHGEEFGDHQAAERVRGADPRGIYGMGHGHAMYQELLHVPLLVWHPDLGGREVEPGVSLVDVAPTVADWLGLPDLDDGWEGRNLAPALASTQTDSFGPEEPLYASGMAYGPPQTVVVWGALKVIQQKRPNQRLLFDLRADPYEQNPLEDPVLQGPLDQLIDDYSQSAISAAEEPPELSPQTIRALQELGYLEGIEAD